MLDRLIEMIESRNSKYFRGLYTFHRIINGPVVILIHFSILVFILYYITLNLFLYDSDELGQKQAKILLFLSATWQIIYVLRIIFIYYHRKKTNFFLKRHIEIDETIYNFVIENLYIEDILPHNKIEKKITKYKLKKIYYLLFFIGYNYQGYEYSNLEIKRDKAINTVKSFIRLLK
jgi:hypothetical protein